MDQTANTLVYQGLRPNTNRTYNSAQKSYLDFCQQHHLQALPASTQILLWYLAYLYKKGIKAESISVYFSAIRSLHVFNGLKLPETNAPKIKLALKAVFEQGSAAVVKSPITYPLLVKMFTLLSPNDYLFRAVFSLAFFGALRGAEYSLVIDSNGETLIHPPLVNSVKFGVAHNGVHYMSYSVKKSKTEPRGFTVNFGCSGDRVCALCCMKQYVCYRQVEGSWLGSLPLFIYENQALNKTHVNSKIKVLVKSLGLDPSLYTTHSFRSGLVTTAYLSGNFSSVEIMKLGRWRSQVFAHYIRPSEIQDISLPHKLFHSLPSNSLK